MKLKLGVLLAVLFILLLLPACRSASEIAETKVIRVIDGDTVVIAEGYHVRYIGIDTPEIGESFYEEARECNQELVDGKTVRLEKDVTDRDEYKRLLRYVYVDSLFVNAELVRQGYARVYPRDRFPDNKYHDLLEEALEEAQREGRGMWGGSG